MRKPKFRDGRWYEWLEKRRFVNLKGQWFDLSYKDQRKRYFYMKNRKNPRKEYYANLHYLRKLNDNRYGHMETNGMGF